VLREVTDSHGVECEGDSENPTSLNMKALCSFETPVSDYVRRRHVAPERRPQLAAHQSESLRRAIPKNCAEPVNFFTYELTRTFSIVTINGRHKDIKYFLYIFIVVIHLRFFGFCHFAIYSLRCNVLLVSHTVYENLFATQWPFHLVTGCYLQTEEASFRNVVNILK